MLPFEASARHGLGYGILSKLCNLDALSRKPFEETWRIDMYLHKPGLRQSFISSADLDMLGSILIIRKYLDHRLPTSVPTTRFSALNQKQTVIYVSWHDLVKCCSTTFYSETGFQPEAVRRFWDLIINR